MVCISQRFVPYPVSFSKPPGTLQCKPRFSSHIRYDEAGRLTALVDAHGKVTAQDHDLAGRLIRREAGNGAVTSFVYDCADRLTQLQNHRSDGTPVNIFTYTYDHAGNRTSALELSGDLTTWTYDPAYQLVHEQRSGTHEFDVTYTYDPAGNRTLFYIWDSLLRHRITIDGIYNTPCLWVDTAGNYYAFPHKPTKDGTFPTPDQWERLLKELQSAGETAGR
jgi:YD repeat-containing protein